MVCINYKNSAFIVPIAFINSSLTKLKASNRKKAYVIVLLN